MRRIAAAIWIALVVAAAVHLGLKAHEGLRFGTDLLALLPQDAGDPARKHAIDRISTSLNRRVLILIGHDDPARARAAASGLSATIEESGIMVPVAGGDGNVADRLGRVYFPYRHGLLAPGDRRQLLAGRGNEIADRATAQLFGPVGAYDARLVRADPFLLLPSFMASLPVPDLRFTMETGLLSRRDGATSWILLPYRLKGAAYALTDQERLVRLLEEAFNRERAAAPGLRMLHTGAVFFAHAGAQASLAEMSRIVIISILCITVMVLAVFRALGPLWQSLLAIGVGILCALSLSFAIFPELHVVALLFGSSLIGTTVDYSMHYCCETFTDETVPERRLRNVLPGMMLGVLTTLIGYLALLLAPFPGLHQIAVFSAVGVVASFATVVLWLPILDRRRTPRHGHAIVDAAGRVWAFWTTVKYRAARLILFFALAIAGAIGMTQIEPVDDIRRMQALQPDMLRQQSEIQRLTGRSASINYFIVQAPDTESALRREEALAERLEELRATGAVGAFRGPAQFVPSMARQRDNARLVAERLVATQFAAHRDRLGMAGDGPFPAAAEGILTLHQMTEVLPFLADLVMTGEGAGVAHVVLLEDVSRPAAVRAAGDGIAGVSYVERAADFSRLLAEYRRAAVVLIVASAILMILALIWRYRPRGALAVMAPPIAAVALTPGILALAGRGFTFFDAMALVLVLAIGVDYALFCAEASDSRRPVTLVAVTLAALSTFLSFGLLAFSSVFAVQAFGATMMCGIAVVFILSPMAQGVRPRTRREPL